MEKEQKRVLSYLVDVDIYNQLIECRFDVLENFFLQLGNYMSEKQCDKK